MANPVLTATLSGQRAILLSWTFGSNADFQVFWKSSVPAGQDMVLLASTNAFSYTTPDLEPSKTYDFYVRANVGATFFYSNTVELFVSCGKGVVLTPDPPPSPPPQQRDAAIDYMQMEQISYRSNNFPYGWFTHVNSGDTRLFFSYTTHFNGSFMVYDYFKDNVQAYFKLDIPHGATVESAVLKLYGQSNDPIVRQLNCTVKGRDVDDCPIATENSYPTGNDGTAWNNAGVAKTSAYGSFVVPVRAGSNSYAGAELSSSDIALVLQEIVNRAGWVRNSRIGIYVYYTGTEELNNSATGQILFHEYNDANPLLRPKLFYAYS